MLEIIFLLLFFAIINMCAIYKLEISEEKFKYYLFSLMLSLLVYTALSDKVDFLLK